MSHRRQLHSPPTKTCSWMRLFSCAGSSWNLGQPYFMLKKERFLLQASTSWFPLFDAAIRVPSMLKHSSAESSTQRAHIGDLAALTDQFLRQCPIGQYIMRLQLVHSMAACALRADLDDVAACLNSLWSFHSLRASIVKTAVEEERRKVSHTRHIGHLLNEPYRWR